MKTCKVCGQIKPLTDYYKVNKKSKFYHGKCKTCYGLSVKENRDPVRARSLYYQRNYGITTEDYDTLYLKQGGQCAVCGSPNPNGPRRANEHFAVDHDHETGKVRGLLCHPCNTTLGLVNDNTETLRNMVAYLSEGL